MCRGTLIYPADRNTAYLHIYYLSIYLYITSRKNIRERNEGVEGEGKGGEDKEVPPQGDHIIFQNTIAYLQILNLY